MLKSFIFTLILTISVAVSQCYAKLGDTEEEITAAHITAKAISKRVIDDDAIMIGFEEETSETICILVNNKVVAETNTDNRFKEWIIKKLHEAKPTDTKLKI